MNIVEKSLRSFIQKKLRMQTFNLYMVLRDSKLFSMIDRWMVLALDHGVREILIDVDINGPDYETHYALLETTFVVRSVDVSSKFYSLQKLTLRRISQNENITQNIVRNCSNLEFWSLEFAWAENSWDF